MVVVVLSRLSLVLSFLSPTMMEAHREQGRGFILHRCLWKIDLGSEGTGSTHFLSCILHLHSQTPGSSGTLGLELLPRPPHKGLDVDAERLEASTCFGLRHF